MSDTLKINSKWKWLAFSQIGNVFLFTKKPKMENAHWAQAGICIGNDVLTIRLKGDWRKSLRRIKDGKLVMP